MLGLLTSFIVFSCLVKTGGKFLWGSCETSSSSLVHQTWDKGLIVFPDRVLRTLTSIQIPDFNGLGIGLFSITLHSFLQGEKLLTWNLDWGDQTPN